MFISFASFLTLIDELVPGLCFQRAEGTGASGLATFYPSAGQL